MSTSVTRRQLRRASAATLNDVLIMLRYMILALQGVIFVAAFTAAFSLRVIGQSTTGMGTAVLMWIVALTSFGVVGLLLHRVSVRKQARPSKPEY